MPISIRPRLDAVSAWRFNPSTCNGKATIAKAVEPIAFSLTEDAAPATSPSEGRADAGTVAAGKDDRELAPDQTAIGAANAAAHLRQLQQEEGVMRLPPHRIDADTTLSAYLNPRTAPYSTLSSRPRTTGTR